jgi:hypothetical protein
MGRLVVRAGGDWLRWVQELADWCRVPVATVTDQALRRYAEAVGWNRRGPARVSRRRDLGTRERVRVEHDHFHGTGAFRPDGTADCPPLPEPGGPDG